MLLALAFVFGTAQVECVAAPLRVIASAAQQRQPPTGEVVIVLDENLLNAFLSGVLQTEGAGAYPLGTGANTAQCRSEVELLPESGGTRTSIRFENNSLRLPIAFRGSYNAALLGCLRFDGTALADLDLFFDEGRQALAARVTVRDLNLRDLPALAGASLRSLVQETINRRLNPVTLLRLDRLTTRLTLNDNAALQVRARSVRPEIIGRELRLRIGYEFTPAP